jgi:hypothetical protein
VTDTGACAAGWDLLADETGDDFSPYLSTSSAGRGIARRHSNSHSARVSEVDQFADPEATASPAKDSGGLRLQHILSDPGLRTLFEDFLRSRFCVENLAFVLEVQEFRKRFATSSSAAAAPASRYVKECGGEMDYHTQELIERAFWMCVCWVHFRPDETRVADPTAFLPATIGIWPRSRPPSSTSTTRLGSMSPLTSKRTWPARRPSPSADTSSDSRFKAGRR